VDARDVVESEGRDVCRIAAGDVLVAVVEADDLEL
jgi:hypothetical protein